MKPSDTPYFASWSGGKDSCLAVHRHVASTGRRPSALLTTFTEEGDRTRGHHLDRAVVCAQAESLGVPLVWRSTSWEGYESAFGDALEELAGQGVKAGVFGDIDLDSHLEWVERVCGQAGMAAVEPLWLEARRTLLAEFFSAGFEAIVVAVRTDRLDPGVLGRRLDAELVSEFEAAGVDACGEEGEYHTVVVDGPLFSRRLELAAAGTFDVDEYRFLDLRLPD